MPGGPWFSQQVMEGPVGLLVRVRLGASGWEGALQLLWGKGLGGEMGWSGSDQKLLQWSRQGMTRLWEILECSITGLRRST